MKAPAIIHSSQSLTIFKEAGMYAKTQKQTYTVRGLQKLLVDFRVDFI